jgi:hypothetical protein
MVIDQAIFTSQATPTGDGYRLVATSSGVTPPEAHELALWGPSHDSLVDRGPSASSINFHQLVSGRYCVSKTTIAGGEYSRRGGLRVYTQSLLLSGEDFQRFANNPFALLRAASAQGKMQPYDAVPPSLEPIRLAGKTPPADYGLLNELLSAPGLDCLAALIDAALTARQLIIISSGQRQHLIAGLFNCLPIECRTPFSFMTGLKPSPARPFRIICQPEESSETRRLCRDRSVRVFRLLDPPPPLQTAWARYVKQILARGKSYALASQLAISRGKLDLESLEPFAESLLTAADDDSRAIDAGEPFDVFPRLAQVAPEATDDDAIQGSVEAGSRRAPHATGPALSVLRPEPMTSSMNRPAQTLSRSAGQTNLQTLEALELLDDTVFAAIAGSTEALERLKQLWPTTLSQVGSRELEESREHYIRRALASWRRFSQEKDVGDPQRALRAIEVVCTLIGE